MVNKTNLPILLQKVLRKLGKDLNDLRHILVVVNNQTFCAV